MKKEYIKPMIEAGTAMGDDMICQTITVSGEYGGGEILGKDRRDNNNTDETTNGKLWDTKW